MNDDDAHQQDRDQIIAEDKVRIAAMMDEDIDFSDMPEMTEEQWNRSVRGKFYRPAKEREPARDDPDGDY